MHCRKIKPVFENEKKKDGGGGTVKHVGEKT